MATAKQTIGDAVAYLRERTDRPGQWEVDIRDRHRGTRRRTTHASREDALAYLAEVQRAVAAEGITTKISVGELVEAFLGARERLGLQAKTLRQNREMLRPAVAFWGAERPVTDLTRRDGSGQSSEIMAYAESRARTVKPATVRHALRILRQALHWARDQRWIDDVPRIEMPPEPEPRQEWLRTPEILPFLEACSPAFRPLAEAALFFGLREAEVCWTQVRDFDQGAAVLWVRPKIGWQPKTGRARGIPITGRAFDIARRVTSGRAPDAWAWPTLEGRQRTTCPWWSKRTKAAAAAAGITRDLVYHDLRRTFGATLVEAGVSLRAVQVALGHRSITTTERVYAPICQGVVAAELAKRDELLDRVASGGHFGGHLVAGGGHQELLHVGRKGKWLE